MSFFNYFCFKLCASFLFVIGSHDASLEVIWYDILYAVICYVKFKMLMVENTKLYVALQLGHNIEKVREKMRELTKQIVNLCSASKCFPYILEGLRSKNNRTRIECVDLIGFIIDHYGAEVKVEVFCLLLVYYCSCCCFYF